MIGYCHLALFCGTDVKSISLIVLITICNELILIHILSQFSELRGICQKATIGFLTLLEHMRYCEVGLGLRFLFGNIRLCMVSGMVSGNVEVIYTVRPQ